MKKVFILTLPLIVFLVLAFFLYDNLGKNSEYLESTLIGKPVPVFNSRLLNLEGGEGQAVDQTFIKGPALVNFWATWCPSCYAEHAMLVQLKKLGVKIYGVDYRDDADKAMGFLSKLGNPYEAIIFDEQADLGFEFGVTGAPETFVIDEKGIVRYRHTGEITEDVWRNKLSKLYYGQEK